MLLCFMLMGITQKVCTFFFCFYKYEKEADWQ